MTDPSVGRPASLATVGGFRPPDDPSTSWLGMVTMLGGGEDWPEGDNEQPMAGIFQVNLAELPHVPDGLRDVAFLSVFMAVDDGDLDAGDFEVRTYGNLGELEEAAGAVTAPGIKAFPLRWALLESDLPDWEDAESDEDNEDAAAEGIKVGGWPSLVQSSLEWDTDEFEFLIQLDSDAKSGLQWGDGGVVYLGRSRLDPDVWELEWQTL